MKGFLKYTLAAIVGFLIAAIIVALIFLGIIGSLVSSAKEDVVVKPNSILQIKLNQEIMERSPNNPLKNFNFGSLKSSPVTGLDDVIEDIRKARTDNNIKGIYLDLTSIPAGTATLEEIRNALIAFKDSSKKFIISYSDTYTQGTYYLASVSDKIYLNPTGLVTFLGLRSEQMYLKGALEKLGVEPEIIRHGKFKAAVEPLINDKMSDENRLQTKTLLDDVWGHILKGISSSRKISIARLNEMADHITLNNAQSALDNKMVDGLKYKDGLLSELAKMSGVKDVKKLSFISLDKYTKVPGSSESTVLLKDKIAVIYAQGTVDMGEGEEGTIGSDRISAAIREARTDSSVKAIVFRVNSGGGSALASEVIWREIDLARKVKPVIASLGDVAASGGYYIVAPCDTIVSEPNTITGSIGVFGILFNAKELFNKKLGITFDGVKTNEHSDIMTFSRPLSAAEKDIIQNGVEDIYNVFVSHVAKGRKMSNESVDAIGQGRVWSGIAAKRIGLVDVLGGLNTAIKIAAEKAKLKKYKIIGLPKLEDPFQELLKNITGEVKLMVLKSELGENYIYYKQAKELVNIQGIQARLPFAIEIY
jgi:protease IV